MDTDDDTLAVGAVSGESRGRRALVLRVAAGLLVVGLLTASTLALLSYRSGVAWRQKALAQQARGDDLAQGLNEAERALALTNRKLSNTRDELAQTEQELGGTEDRLEATTGKLKKSEADVAQLEGRVQTIANEKAQVEDEREIVEQERDYYADTASLATDVGALLSDCVDGVYSWLGQTPSMHDSAGSWDSWSSYGDAVAGLCGDAQDGYAELQSLLPG